MWVEKYAHATFVVVKWENAYLCDTLLPLYSRATKATHTQSHSHTHTQLHSLSHTHQLPHTVAFLRHLQGHQQQQQTNISNNNKRYFVVSTVAVLLLLLLLLPVSPPPPLPLSHSAPLPLSLVGRRACPGSCRISRYLR